MAINKKEVSINVAYAMIAQTISLALSVLMSLFVPKILNIEGFGYWQLFIFYTSYSGMLHFGLYDGLYLRLGGKEYSKLSYEIVGTQFRLSVALQVVILSVIALCGITLVEENRRFVIVSSCIMALISNVAGFVGLLQQAVNRTKINSISVIINRCSFIIILLSLLFYREKWFGLYIIGYMAAQCMALAYCIYVTRELLFSKNVFTRKILGLFFGNMKIGLILTFANIASIFIIGIGRFFIDGKWGIETFSKVSFALTMTHFVLIFVNQVGLVFFPALRRCNANEIKSFYRKARKTMIIYLPVSFVFVYPLIWFINSWLPKYNESIPFFFIMIPLCIYDGRMQMIGYTMLKVLRKERLLLYINIVAVAISCLFCALSVYVFDNVTLTIIGMLVAIVTRAVITDVYFAKKYSLHVFMPLALEILLVAMFIIVNLTCSWTVSLGLFVAAYMVYFLLNKYKVQY